MSRLVCRYIVLLGILAPTSLLIGCGDASSELTDPYLLQQRSRLLLNDEPSGAVGIVAARKGLEGPKPVVLEGRIGSSTGTTWDPDRASFSMLDLSLADPRHANGSDHDHDHSESAAHQDAAHDHAHHDHGGHDHDHDNCAFCEAAKTAALESTAIVQLVDLDGAVLPVDARKLLGLREKQLVVVRGQAQINTLGQLVVAADGIFVRQ